MGTEKETLVGNGLLKSSKLGEDVFPFQIRAPKTGFGDHICRNTPQILLRSNLCHFTRLGSRVSFPFAC